MWVEFDVVVGLKIGLGGWIVKGLGGGEGVQG
jgi:hypothetical protein